LSGATHWSNKFGGTILVPFGNITITASRQIFDLYMNSS